MKIIKPNKQTHSIVRSLFPIKGGRSQAATEFLLITAFFLLLIIPTVFYFYSYAQEAAVEVEISKAENIGNAIVDTAESAFYYGRFSKLTLNVDMPAGVKNINVTCAPGREACDFNIYILDQELFFPSNVPINGTFEQKDFVQGRHDVVLETKHNLEDYVEIDFK